MTCGHEFVFASGWGCLCRCQKFLSISFCPQITVPLTESALTALRFTLLKSAPRPTVLWHINETLGFSFLCLGCRDHNNVCGVQRAEHRCWFTGSVYMASNFNDRWICWVYERGVVTILPRRSRSEEAVWVQDRACDVSNSLLRVCPWGLYRYI